MPFTKQVLDIDPAFETERLINALRETVYRDMRRRGAVLGISGGVDSSVVLALCVRAFGGERVLPLILPEKDSDPISERIARSLAEELGVAPLTEVITPALEGFGCYPRRDEAIRRVFPDYDAESGYKAKIVLPQSPLETQTLNVFYLTIITPQGEEQTKRLPPREYFQIVAASNFKQRTRMMYMYYHAELNNYAVVGTANRNEHMQGFFVKYGDGGADVKPILHLYKTQVYQLAEYLGIPEDIRTRPPTSDTYSAPSTQEEFFFRLPFATMDLLWYAQENGYSPAEVAPVMGLSEAQIQNAYDDFTRKKRTTDYLRTPPVTYGELAVESLDK
jgi:NAD+ synthase